MSSSSFSNETDKNKGNKKNLKDESSFENLETE